MAPFRPSRRRCSRLPPVGKVRSAIRPPRRGWPQRSRHRWACRTPYSRPRRQKPHYCCVSIPVPSLSRRRRGRLCVRRERPSGHPLVPWRGDNRRRRHSLRSRHCSGNSISISHGMPRRSPWICRRCSRWRRSSYRRYHRSPRTTLSTNR